MDHEPEDQFFELALRKIAGQASQEKLAKLDVMIKENPELGDEYKRLEVDSKAVKEILPLQKATEATEGEFPEYAMGMLQAEVKEVLGHEDQEGGEEVIVGQSSPSIFLRWATGLAAVTGMIALGIYLANQDKKPAGPRQIAAPKEIKVTVHLAMIDIVGQVRGEDDERPVEIKKAWPEKEIANFDHPKTLEDWEAKIPENTKGPIVKIVYDLNAEEVRVLGKWKGETRNKTLPVEDDLAAVLAEAKKLVEEWYGGG